MSIIIIINFGAGGGGGKVKRTQILIGLSKKAAYPKNLHIIL